MLITYLRHFRRSRSFVARVLFGVICKVKRMEAIKCYMFGNTISLCIFKRDFLDLGGLCVGGKDFSF